MQHFSSSANFIDDAPLSAVDGNAHQNNNISSQEYSIEVSMEPAEQKQKQSGLLILLF